jgi:hypothetical protein
MRMFLPFSRNTGHMYYQWYKLAVLLISLAFSTSLGTALSLGHSSPWLVSSRCNCQGPSPSMIDAPGFDGIGSASKWGNSHSFEHRVGCFCQHMSPLGVRRFCMGWKTVVVGPFPPTIIALDLVCITAPVQCWGSINFILVEYPKASCLILAPFPVGQFSYNNELGSQTSITAFA